LPWIPSFCKYHETFSAKEILLENALDEAIVATKQRNLRMMRVLVLGGGPAGLFAGISAMEQMPGLSVAVCERAPVLAPSLRELRRGGGVITRDAPSPEDFAAGYSRGAVEMLGPLAHWSPADTLEWFRARGAVLRECGGAWAMESPAALADLLEARACELGVELLTGHVAVEVARGPDGLFRCWFEEREPQIAERLIVATGSGRNRGYAFARGFGHEPKDEIPALFEFTIKDKRLHNLHALELPPAEVSAVVPDAAGGAPRHWTVAGELRITPKGLGGQAVVDLSSRIAPYAAAREHRFTVSVNFVAGQPRGAVQCALSSRALEHPKRAVHDDPLESVPPRLWQRLAEAAGIRAEDRWVSIDARRLHALHGQLTGAHFKVSGYSRHKPEFCNCGGIRLDELDCRRFESRFVPGLHFCGEILDVDGLTGGYNMQLAWTSARLASRAGANW